jgi:hypothetical protein
MHDHWLFVWNVLSHLVASMSGVASFLMSMWEHTKGRKIESRVFFIVGVICLVVAFDQAWQDEHRNSQLLTAEKSVLSSESGFWREQSYAKDESLRSRDQLLSQNYTALIGEQSTANRTQDSLTQLSGKILDIGKPVPWKWQALVLGLSSGTSPMRDQFLLITNKAMIPVDVIFSCSQQITNAESRIVANPSMEQTVRLDDTHWESKITSPAWTPESPIEIDIIKPASSSPNTCNFHIN